MLIIGFTFKDCSLVEAEVGYRTLSDRADSKKL